MDTSAEPTGQTTADDNDIRKISGWPLAISLGVIFGGISIGTQSDGLAAAGATFAGLIVISILTAAEAIVGAIKKTAPKQ